MSSKKTTQRKSALKSLKRKDTVGIIFLGDVEIGKSAIIQRWMNDEFPDKYGPTVEDFFMKTVISLNQRVNVTIIDIAGSRQFPTMDDLYIGKSDILVLTYEIGNENSIASLKRYFEAAQRAVKEKKVCYLVVGTKSDIHDLDSTQSVDVGHEYFTELQEPPTQFVTSAKTGHNVKELFEHAIQEILKRYGINEKRAKFERQITLEAMAENDEGKEKVCCSIL